MKYFYIVTLVCVSMTRCQKHYIIETQEEDNDDIRTDVKLIYDDKSSGDYSGQKPCNGVTLTCTTKEGREIEKDTCTFT